ncbi:MAG: glycosyltransferase [Thermoanaerobaculia bacterium]
MAHWSSPAVATITPGSTWERPTRRHPPPRTSPRFDHLRAGRHEPGGSHGGSTLLARCFYSIACQYYRHRLSSRPGRDWDEPLGALFERLLRDGDLSGLSAGDRLRLWAAGALRPRAKTMGTIDRRLIEELAELATPSCDGATDALEERCFRIAGRLSHDLSFGALKKFGKHLAKGRLTESLQSLSSLGPALLAVAPYLAACHTQHKDEELHCRVEERFGLPVRAGRAPVKAWFTDVFHGEDGPSGAVRGVASLARRRGLELHLVTSQGASDPGDPERVDFAPLGRVRLREMGDLEVAFPPFLDMLAFCERERFTEILVSTPGPVGLVGLAAAKLLGVPLTAVYTGDLRERVARATSSPTLEAVMGRLVVWFFGQADRIFVPSAELGRELERRGLAASRLRVAPELFPIEVLRADAAA